MRPSVSCALLRASLSRPYYFVKNSLGKRKSYAGLLTSRFDAQGLDDAARPIVPLLRTKGLICSDELTILRSSSRLKQGALEATTEQIGHFDEERPAIASETGF